MTKTLQEHFLATASATLLLGLVDHLLVKPFVSTRVPKKNPRDIGNCRWFFTHALANAFIVVFGLRALWTTLTDPHNAVDSRVYSDDSFFGAASSWPLTFVNAVHVYHMIGGFPLTGADYFHRARARRARAARARAAERARPSARG
jgi:hypothetical protein